MRIIIILTTLFFTTLSFAMRSDLDITSIRFDDIKGSTNERSIFDEMTYGGFNDLTSFVTSAPDQEDAGSCLYMSHTASIEWWYNYLNNLTDKNKIKFSERYYMALKTEKIGQENIKNWRTDNIERINAEGKILENKFYPFTKGHFKRVDSKRVATNSSDKAATYNTEFNWISFKNEVDDKYSPNFISVPKFKREVIFKDVNRNQWNVGDAPVDIVQQIKEALVNNHAPVNVIYNHHGFWHAVVIVGFNDIAPTKGCPYISGYKPFMEKKAQGLEEDAHSETDQEKKDKLISRAKNTRRLGDKANSRYIKDGGCNEHGVFYVRDSINPDKTLDLYDYDPTRSGEEEHLNAPIIYRSYQWFNSTGNHAFQILKK